jgi:hypothetical protein
MEGWLEWFEERCAILEFDAGMTRSDAETHMAAIAHSLMLETGERPDDLMSSRYKHHFYGLLNMGMRVLRDVEVVEYRWRIVDGCVRLYYNYATDEEAHALFGERWHERVDETRRIGKRAIYRE